MLLFNKLLFFAKDRNGNFFTNLISSGYFLFTINLSYVKSPCGT